jgi:hypothetical protein
VKVICGQGCVGACNTGVARLFVYSRAAKVDATKKRTILKKRIKLSDGFILLSEMALKKSRSHHG